MFLELIFKRRKLGKQNKDGVEIFKVEIYIFKQFRYFKYRTIRLLLFWCISFILLQQVCFVTVIQDCLLGLYVVFLLIGIMLWLFVIFVILDVLYFFFEYFLEFWKICRFFFFLFIIIIDVVIFIDFFLEINIFVYYMNCYLRMILYYIKNFGLIFQLVVCEEGEIIFGFYYWYRLL